jgi:uncharacterized repeat protein (TIGR03847 family)
MPRRRHLFDQPDRFIAGTIGAPGNRTFFLQARDGARTVAVSLEKIQVAVLAARLNDLLEELDKRGIEGAGEIPDAVGDIGSLDEPLNEAFRAGTLALGWDTADELILLEAREITELDEDDEDADLADDDDDADEDDDESEFALTLDDPDDAAAEDGPDIFQIRFSAADARQFVARAMRVLAAGRPPCPLCGQPLDPQGHLCPRRNGHLLN